MLFRIYKPEVFQGNLKKRHYFEGWYFKHVTSDQTQTISIIPGISLAEKDSHSFIQVMIGNSGTSRYIRYQVNEFRWERQKMFISVGSSEFSMNHARLDIKDDDFELTGELSYCNPVKYPGSVFSPGIMGWYSFIPFMECKHGIVSAIHGLNGNLSVNGTNVSFESGKGYIEKDWGSSFPEAWIWIQSNNFKEPGTSFSFSLAKIPWLGSFFTGFISFLYLRQRFYLFSTYNRSEVYRVIHRDNTIELSVRNRNYSLNIQVLKNSFGDLRAPRDGEMSRKIKESMDSEVHLELFDKSNNLEYSDTGKCVGLEVIEKIFDYV